ncbi:hypothetical protein P9Z80_14535, partial [Bacillus cereus]|nr:hypothetical protein [Bacillus cereus]
LSAELYPVVLSFTATTNVHCNQGHLTLTESSGGHSVGFELSLIRKKSQKLIAIFLCSSTMFKMPQLLLKKNK